MGNYQQFNLFNFGKEKKVITKPIRLIELFAGIGAQHKALSVLGVPFESWKICEWAIPSIKAYNSIHIKDFTDYSVGKSRDEMIERINGVSQDSSNPLSDKQLSKLPLDKVREIYNNCIATHNLINIMNVKGKDLEIVDTDIYEYILTYSFPCQDLSLAGKRAGMEISQANGGTRSGLLWEVERILDELNREREREHSSLPQVLLMENVPELIGKDNVQHFNKWLDKLESLGYANFFDILNAKDYGVPQNRRRVFMVSILQDDKEYSYDFPLKVELKYYLKNYLEDNVSEKYYLSKKMVDYISASNDKWTGNNDNAIVNRDVCCTINTAPTQRRCDASNYIADDLPPNANLKEYLDLVEKPIENGDAISLFNSEDFGGTKVIKQMSPTIKASKVDCGVALEEYGSKILNETLEKNDIENGDFIDGFNRVVNKNGLVGTITTGIDYRNCSFVAVEEEIGYTEESLKRIKNNVCEDEVAPTITANAMQSINHQNCVLIKEATKKGYKEAKVGDGIDISTRMESHRGTVQKGIAQTITTEGGENVGVVVEEKTNEKENKT